MDKFFQSDSGILGGFSRVLDLILLNMLFLLTSLPVFTIGASLSALYSITMKMVRDEESHLIRSYLKAFKKNFKQATLFWLTFCFFISIFCADYVLFTQNGSTLFLILKALLILFAVCMWSVGMYCLPLTARFYFTNMEILKHAFYIAVKHFPYTLLLLVLYAPCIFLMTYSIYTMAFFATVFAVIGTAAYAYIQSYLFRNIFSSYELDGNSTA